MSWNLQAMLQQQIAAQQQTLQQQAAAGLPTLHQFSDTPVENANPDFSYGDPNNPGTQPGWSQAINDLMTQMGGNDQMNSGYNNLSNYFQQPGTMQAFQQMYPGSQDSVNSLLKFGYGQSHGLDNGYGSLADIAPMVLAIGGGALAGAAGGATADAASAIPASEAGVGTGMMGTNIGLSSAAPMASQAPMQLAQADNTMTDVGGGMGNIKSPITNPVANNVPTTLGADPGNLGFTQNGAFGQSIFDSTLGTNPAGVGAGGIGGAADVGLTGLGNVGVGTGLADAGGVTAGTGAATGGGILDTIKGFLGTDIGSAIGGLGSAMGVDTSGMPSTGITLKDLLSTGLSAYQANRAGQGLSNLAGQMSQQSSLDQSQRLPYQQQFANMVNNPSQYMSTDPFVQALTNQYRNNVIPRNIAQSGNAANVIDQQGSQFASAISQDYGQKLGLMSGAAGFGFPQQSSTPYMTGVLGTGAIAQQGNKIGDLGNLFGMNLSGTAGSKGLFGTGQA